MKTIFYALCALSILFYSLHRMGMSWDHIFTVACFWAGIFGLLGTIVNWAKTL